jgi:hypothetical protein
MPRRIVFTGSFLHALRPPNSLLTLNPDIYCNLDQGFVIKVADLVKTKKKSLDKMA